MILVIDNYDSFTFNLVQYLLAMNEEVLVRRNDELTLADVTALAPEMILVSPGPCSPAEAGLSVPVIREFSGRIPILGVCLGHQSIGAAFGARIVRAQRIMHGKVSAISHDGQSLFAGLPSPVKAIRYHSLVIQPDSLPDCLEVTARDEIGEIMGVRHLTHRTEGVQFHPESILTTSGKRMLANFLKTIRTPL